MAVYTLALKIRECLQADALLHGLDEAALDALSSLEPRVASACHTVHDAATDAGGALKQALANGAYAAAEASNRVCECGDAWNP